MSPRKYHPWTDQEIDVIRAAAGALTAAELADQLPGRKPDDVRQAVKRYDLPLKVERRFSNRANGWNDDTENSLIRQCVLNGLTSIETANWLATNGYSRSPGAIRSGRPWKAARIELKDKETQCSTSD